MINAFHVIRSKPTNIKNHISNFDIFQRKHPFHYMYIMLNQQQLNELRTMYIIFYHKINFFYFCHHTERSKITILTSAPH